MVNPLGFRLPDTDKGPPSSAAGAPQCPDTAQIVDFNAMMKGDHWQEDKTRDPHCTIVFAPVQAGQGYIFHTRWSQHTALQIMDMDITAKEPEKNCRSSFEARFWIVGQTEPEVCPPSVCPDKAAKEAVADSKDVQTEQETVDAKVRAVVSLVV